MKARLSGIHEILHVDHDEMETLERWPVVRCGACGGQLGHVLGGCWVRPAGWACAADVWYQTARARRRQPRRRSYHDADLYMLPVVVLCPRCGQRQTVSNA